MDDTYNANPDSVRAAIDGLSRMGVPGLSCSEIWVKLAIRGRTFIEKCLTMQPSVSLMPSGFMAKPWQQPPSDRDRPIF